MRIPRLMFLLVLSSISLTVSAETFNVDTHAAFQDALTRAQANFDDDTINVDDGFYDILTNGTLTYTAAATEAFSLSILGNDSTFVILDGGMQLPILRIDTTLVTQGDAVGITVTNMTFDSGNAAGTGEAAHGGALYINMNSGMIVMVTGSEFYDNAADGDGGAIYIRGNVLEGIYLGDLTLDFNTARGIATGSGGDGGGAYIAGGFNTVVEVIDIFFWDNVARGVGAGISIEGLLPGDPCGNVTFYDLEFDGNQISNAGSGGGAAVLATDLRVDTSGFYANTATTIGGGMHLRGNTRLYMKNSGFLGNTAGIGGGLGTDPAADSGIILEHNTFAGNTAATEGGGIYMARGGSTLVVSFYNNIMWANSGQTGADLYIDDDPYGLGGFDVATVELFHNDYDDFTTACTLDPNCTEDIQLTNNISVDPLLDFSGHLMMNSPCIDTGLNSGHPSYAPILVDADFDQRPFDGDNDGTATVDIGADEYVGAPQAADLVITKSDSPDPVTGGQNLTYTITVTNNGPSDATGVTMTDTLPSTMGVTFMSANASQGNCSDTSGVVSCLLGSIVSGSNAIVTIVVTTPQVGVNTPISNSASVTATQNDDNPSNNSITEATTVVPEVPAQADLAITKVGTPDPVFTGGPQLTYGITLTNNGPDGATGIVVTDTLPDGVDYVSSSISTGGECSAAVPTVTCNIPPMALDESVSISIVVRPQPVTEQGQLTNRVDVLGVEIDPDMTNNTATVTTDVNPPEADMMVDVSVSPTDPQIGDVVRFTITVTNDGPSDTDGVVVNLTAPVQGTVGSITPSQGTCVAISAGIACDIGAMNAGASITITVVVTAPQLAADLLLSVSTSSNTNDPTMDNNSASGTVTVIEAIELVIKGVGGGSGSFGLAGLLMLLAAALVALLPVSESRAQGHWYVDAAVGQATANYSGGDLTNDLASLGWSITNPSVDDKDTAYKIFGGYSFNQNFAVEVGYVELGEVKTEFGANIPPSEVNDLLSDTFAVHPYLGKGWVAAGVASWPFASNRFALLARAGVFRWDADIDVWVESGATGSVTGSDSGTDLMWGAGLEWKATQSFSVTAQWERYRLNDWVDVPTVGVRFYFQ